MDNNNEQKFTYYSRIVMMIIMTIEFILNLIFLITIIEVKDNKYEKDCEEYNTYYDYSSYYRRLYGIIGTLKAENDIFFHHYQGISASFSLFFISYFIFVIEFVTHFICENSCSYDILELILRKLNHLIVLITFFIGQFLYLIDCMIIPVFYQRVDKLYFTYYEIFCNEKEVKSIKSKIKGKYTLLIVLCFIFLFLILFLDFIVLNLYKGICCSMEEICTNTQKCCENFGRGFVNKLGILCCKNDNDEGIIQLEKLENENDREIHNLTGDIRHLLAQYVELSTKDLLSVNNN